MHQRLHHIAAAWSENKQECSESERERVSDDVMELNDTKLNYIYFKTDSDDASKKLNEDFVL